MAYDATENEQGIAHPANNCRVLHGRRKILIPDEVITADNVLSIMQKVLKLHIENLEEEEYLFNYRRGVQPILQRVKEVRPEICNKIVVNNAEEVVTFKNGFFLQKPISYVSRREDEAITNKVRELNEYLYCSGKAQADNEAVNWFHTVGLGVLYVEPNKGDDKEDAPVKVYALDPRSAFVVYSLRPGNAPVMGINMVVAGNDCYFDVYTNTNVFRLRGTVILGETATEGLKPCSAFSPTTIEAVEPNILGLIPIIEYQYNENRMSAFEPAISIMDAINTVESNRIDGVEQNIQQLCIAYNCRFEEGITANTIRQAGMIELKSTNENKADFKILESGIDQTSTQVTLDNLYEQMLHKCSMPTTTKGGTSTSDTGTAVYLRDGYQIADTAARNTTDLFEASERLFDKVFLRILKDAVGFDLKVSDFALRIERNSASNLINKTQAALNLKELGFAPELAFERSGISSDPLNDVEVSGEYIKQHWSAPEPEISPDKPEESDGSTNADTPSV